MFNFGQSQIYGSIGRQSLNRPIGGGVKDPFLEGYWMVASNGGIFSFGSAGFYGSTGSLTLNKPVVAMAARPPFAVEVDPYAAVSSETLSWVNTGTSWQLQLTNTSGGSVPAGTRVLGVEGLDVSQLQTMGFMVASGTCSAAERPRRSTRSTGPSVQRHFRPTTWSRASTSSSR